MESHDTAAQARRRCHEDQQCAGFTFEHRHSEPREALSYFFKPREAMAAASSENTAWKSFVKVLSPCSLLLAPYYSAADALRRCHLARIVSIRATCS